MKWQLVELNPSAPINAYNAGTDISSEGGAADFANTRVSAYSMSVDALVEIGFSTFAKFKVHADAVFLTIDVMAFTNQSMVTDVDKDGLYLKKMGVGFRIALAAWGLDASASLNLTAIAASVEVKSASSSLEVQITSNDVLSIPGLSDIMDISGGKADTKFISDLGKYAANLTEAFVTQKPQIEPTPLKIARLPQAQLSPVHSAISNRFAVEQVRRAQPFSGMNAWVEPRPDYHHMMSPGIVANGFRSFGLRDGSQTPDPDQVKAANEMQILGW